MENNLMTVFTRIFHTQGDSLVELSAWIENVRNGQWKNEVENYRIPMLACRRRSGRKWNL